MVENFTSIFFIIMSLIVIFYIYYSFKSSKRVSILVELLFFGVYGLIILFFIFPSLLKFIETTFGISSAINFFLYLSIFVLFFIVFYLYKEKEKQRVEITKLVREIAFIKKK